MNDLTKLLGAVSKAAVKIDTEGFYERSSATETDFVPDILPQNVTLRGYQMAAVETILKYRRGILGFLPGMGKTLPALTVAANTGRTVCVVPPSLTLDPWVVEIEKCFPDLYFHVMSGRKRYDLPDCDIIICGDAIVDARQDDIIAWQPDCFIVDEAQRHKDTKAKRAKAVAEIAKTVRAAEGTVVELTGTLATNHAEEVYMPAKIVGVAGAINGGPGTYQDWINKWCYLDQMRVEKKVKDNETKSIWIQVPKGAKDPMGLHEALRQTAYIRVEREDVLDMPDKLVVPRFVPGSDSGLKEYKSIETDFTHWLQEHEGSEEARERALRAEKLVQLGKMVEAAGLAKIDAAVEYVAALVEQQEQVVVMAHNKSVVRAFQDALNDAGVSSVRFTGSETAEQKAKAVADFKGGKFDVLVGNIKAAGTGLNLENSANLVFIQLPWSPADFEQASDRIYRVTQKRDCTIHVLNIQDTVDERIWSVLENKAQIVNCINAGTPCEMQDSEVLEEVLESYL